MAIMLFNSLRIAFTYAYYYLDPVDFIERLCENKDKPELQCNGKCYLAKIIEKNKTEKPTPAKEITFEKITLYFLDPFEYAIFGTSQDKYRIGDYHNLYSYIGIYSFYHPPQV